MLVLTRRPGERVILRSKNGDRVEFTLVQVNGNNVRVGIEAPKHIEIIREEIEETPKWNAGKHQ